MLVGGFAAFAHGSSLQTRDVDICIRLSTENLMRIQTAFVDLHPVHRSRPDIPLALTPDECSRFKNLYLKTDLGIIDCLGEVLAVGGILWQCSISRRCVRCEMMLGAHCYRCVISPSPPVQLTDKTAPPVADVPSHCGELASLVSVKTLPLSASTASNVAPPLPGRRSSCFMSGLISVSFSWRRSRKASMTNSRCRVI